MRTTLGKRNIGIFSADLNSFDFKMRKPEQVRQSVMARLKKRGKGIVLLHDFHRSTGEAAMALLNDLKAGGYKIVFRSRSSRWPRLPPTTSRLAGCRSAGKRKWGVELCGLVEDRVIDLDGVYDPCRPNDRLLLGKDDRRRRADDLNPEDRNEAAGLQQGRDVHPMRRSS